jgi:hypothetical protein
MSNRTFFQQLVVDVFSARRNYPAASVTIFGAGLALGLLLTLVF